MVKRFRAKGGVPTLRGKQKPKAKAAPRRETIASTFTSITTAKWGDRGGDLYIEGKFHLGLPTI